MLSIQKQVQADLDELRAQQDRGQAMRQWLYKQPDFAELKKVVTAPDATLISDWWGKVLIDEKLLVAIQKLTGMDILGLDELVRSIRFNSAMQIVHRLEAATLMQSLASAGVTTYQGLKKHFSKNYKSN